MKGISSKEMTGHKETVFWYIYDEINQQLVAAPDDQANEAVVILFKEKEDAQTWKFIVSKTPAYQDGRLDVRGDRFQSIFEDSLEHQEFRVFPVDSDEARKFFEAYKDILRTREFEEERNKNFGEFNDQKGIIKSEENMPDQETYTVEFTNHELNSLNELLGNLRKIYAEREGAINNPLFVEACKLHFKIAQVLMPSIVGKVTLDDYFDLGRN